MAQIAVRFVFHPWGSKYVTLPLFACVILGMAAFVRLLWRDKLRSTMLPLVVLVFVQLVFELGWMDPADGARYSLAFMPLVALLAALGLDVVRRSIGFAEAPWVITAILATATIVYAWPLIGTRTTLPSPPAAAAAYANTHLPTDSVIGYDIALKPHAEYLMSRFRLLPIEKAIAEVYDHPDVPLVLFTNGRSHEPDAHVFAWPESDAYWKLTRDLYREVALDPRPARERYLPVRGAYAIEHTPEGDAWRWLSPDATIRLPRDHGNVASMSFRLTPDAPYESDVVQISVNGRDAQVITVGKQSLVTKVSLPAEPQVDVRFRSSRSFAPGATLHNQDPRVLAVQLTRVETGVGPR